MNTSIYKLCSWIIVLAVLLAACSPAATPAVVPTAAPSPTPKPSIDLQPCTLGSTAALCGTLRVPENRDAPGGRSIDLRVAVIKASSPDRVPDPIFYLAGGPGGAATEDAAKSAQFSGSLSDTHDLVFVDQRGTGGSHSVRIPPGPDFTGMTLEQANAKLAEWVPQMLKTLDMDPRYYTTSVAMDDLDAVRAALGYDKINLFGHSYGATAVQYYLRQYEEHVRSAVVSGGSLLDIPTFEVWAKNGQQELDLLFERCAADERCHSAYPNLRAEFSALLEQLAQQPVTQDFKNPADGQPASVTFSRDLFAEIVRVTMLDAKNAAELPRLIHLAYAKQDWMGITNYYIRYGPGDWGDQFMERVIRCWEKWAAFSPDEVARQSQGSYLAGWYASLAQSHALACKYTPVGVMPEGKAAQVGSQVPVLFFNGQVDPQDPPQNVSGAKALFPNSLSVVEPYQGHWLSDYSEISCRWSIQDQFIQKGSAQGVDVSCMQKISPPTFNTRD